MAQVFKPSANTYARLTIFGAVFAVGGLLFALAGFTRSDYMTRAKVAREQPVALSFQQRAVPGAGDQLGVVGQDGQESRLGPAQLGGAAVEIEPGGGIQPDEVAAELAAVVTGAIP